MLPTSPSTPAILTRLRAALYHTRYEPFLTTAGLFLFTALYYTRRVPFQIASFGVMVAVALYWSRALRGKQGMSWSDFKLKRDQLGLNILLASGLAIFGWLYFKGYLFLTRGEPIRFEFGGSFPSIFAILVVASAEELFFRGYLQNRLRLHYSLWKRVLLSVFFLALFKNVVHMWEGFSLLAHLELLFLGVLHNVLASLWLEWSDNLTGPLLLHIFWDLLVYAPLSAIPYWVY